MIDNGVLDNDDVLRSIGVNDVKYEHYNCVQR